jgi:hypothetical protein
MDAQRSIAGRVLGLSGEPVRVPRGALDVPPTILNTHDFDESVQVRQLTTLGGRNTARDAQRRSFRP